MTPEMKPINKVGRLDIAASEGLGRLADALGANFGIPLRPMLQGVIDRFVSENVTDKKLPVTPEAIAERMGILKKRGKR